MTRERRLREVLNLRLDEPLARELRRIAASRGTSESEVARNLLGYGIEVSRRIEAEDLARPFSWEEERPNDDWPERPRMLVIDVSWREMTDEELVARGLGQLFLSDEDEELHDAP